MASAGGDGVPSPAFGHEALLYAGRHDFLAGAVPFIREGLARDEPVLVVVDAVKIAALREALDGSADRVRFTDIAHLHGNPARVIGRWRQFIEEHVGVDRPVRGIGEPICADQGQADLVQCQAHETLLNFAFTDRPAWTLLCPYDVEALEPAVVQEARRRHPFVVRGGVREPSGVYLDAHRLSTAVDRPLSPPPADAEVIGFEYGADALKMVRAVVSDRAGRAGLGATATANLVLAVNELVTDSLRHGSGRGTIRLWCEGDTVVCEVHDDRRVDADAVLGQAAPTPDQAGERGLWLTTQLCDLVQIRSTPTGTTVRLHVRRTTAPADPTA